MNLTVEEICEDLITCKSIYYRNNHFLYESRLWAFTYWFNPFLVTLFTHNGWMALSFTAIFEIIEEISIFISIRYEIPWVEMKTDWEQAETLIDISLAILGILTAKLIVFLFKYPRIVRHPYTEINSIKKEYKCNEIKGEAFKKSNIIKFVHLNIKYFFQLSMIQYVPSRAFLLVENVYDQEVIKIFAREDWVVYFSSVSFLISMLFLMNYSTKIEKEVIWEYDKKKYTQFYLFLLITFLILTLPYIYTWTHPKVSVLMSNAAIVILFLLIRSQL